MKRYTSIVHAQLIVFAICAILVPTGCRNPFLIEMFGDNAVADIVITNNLGQRINTFDPDTLSYTYVIDSPVQIKLTLQNATSVFWGYNNFDNPYTGEILVGEPQGGSKQLTLTATGRRGKAKVYMFTFSSNQITDTGEVWYVAADNGDDNFSGSDSAPFKTLGRAVQAVKNSADGTMQTIYVSGTLNYASESTTPGDTDVDSVFYISELNADTPTPIMIIGKNGATLENETTNNNSTRRTLKVDNSTVTVKNLTIKSNAATNKDGGAIYIGTNAAVTLADGADVQGMGTASNGTGVYAGGTLSFAGSGTVSTVGNDGCDVYLPSNRSIQIVGELTATLVAKITTQAIPTKTLPVRVLDNSSSRVGVHYTQFSASDTQYAITSDGMMKPMELTGNVYYVKNGGGLFYPDGLSISTAFESLDAAVAAASTHSKIKTICVVGTLTTGNAANTDSESVFVINNTGSAQITIRGIDGILSAVWTTKRAVKVESGSGPVKFESIRITGANTTVNGGGLFIGTNTEVEFGDNVEISGNTVTAASGINGGGVYNTGTLTITGSNTSICHNTASNYPSLNGTARGAGVYNSGVFIINGSNARISYNKANGTGYANGGGVYTDGTLTINGSNATISYNEVYADKGNSGGGVWNSGTLAINGSTTSISHNTGNGVYNYESAAVLTISGSNTSISHNSDTGVYNNNEIIISGNGTSISHNTSKSRGGGVSNAGSSASFTISGNNTSISHNASTSSGGGVYTAGTRSIESVLTISGSNTSISHNTAGSTGGGVDASNAAVTVSSAVTINNNTASQGGGLNGVPDADDTGKWKYGTGGAANSPNDYE